MGSFEQLEGHWEQAKQLSCLQLGALPLFVTLLKGHPTPLETELLRIEKLSATPTQLCLCLFSSALPTKTALFSANPLLCGKLPSHCLATPSLRPGQHSRQANKLRLVLGTAENRTVLKLLK